MLARFVPLAMVNHVVLKVSADIHTYFRLHSGFLVLRYGRPDIVDFDFWRQIVEVELFGALGY